MHVASCMNVIVSSVTVQCIAMRCAQKTVLIFVCFTLSFVMVLHNMLFSFINRVDIVNYKNVQLLQGSETRDKSHKNVKCVLHSDHRSRRQMTHFKKRVKTVLYWNNPSNGSKVDIHIGEIPSNPVCSVDNCVVTTNRNCDVEIEDFDAVIFNMFAFPEKTYVIRNGVHGVLSEDIPLKRKPHQRYVFLLMEPPGEFSSDLKRFDNYFNWTMTYRKASDIVIPYGYFTNISTPPGYNDESPVNPMIWRTPDVPPRDWMDAVNAKVSRKTKLVAWFVSKCETSSERELYVQELARFIDVDTYGSCGTLKCKDRSECYKMLGNEYKFYLSFESSLWEDYVTEELFAVMKLDVVPVVYGAANYSLVAPPESYINARDFDSPRHLAQYLWHLDDHHREYSRFFWWKRYYTVRQDTNHALCKLCEMLNSSEMPGKSYSDIHEWFSDKNKNYTADELFPF